MASRVKGRFIKKTEKERRAVASQNISKLNAKKSKNISKQQGQSFYGTPDVWSPGERRIFEPDQLRESMFAGYESCGEELKFTRVVSETVCGLGSMFYIVCACGVLNKVNSEKVHYEKEKNRTRPIFDVNSKLAIAMYDTEIGLHQIHRFLTNITLTWYIPNVAKKREKEVFEPIRTVAKRSMDESLEVEMRATEQMNVLPSGDNVPLAVQNDMGWQKRGSGRNYNSK